jgi:RNA polymerase sigma-70 factor, ECF subfamily
VTSPQQITQLLIAWGKGDETALDQLTPLVYQELHRMARRFMSRQNPGHTLQPTALINEAYVRLVGDSGREWQDRAHFFAIAATAMRHILVDHARASTTAKRGGEKRIVPLDEAGVSSVDNLTELVALDEALNELAKLNTRQCKVVELRYFAGLSVDETAKTLKISVETAMRDWRVAKAWLYDQLRGAARKGCS